MINSCSPARPHFYTLRADTLTQTHTLLTSSCWDKQPIKKWKEWVYLTVTHLYKPVTLCRALLNRTPPVNQLACAACCSGNAHGAKIAPHLSCPENSMNLGGYNSAGKHCTPFHKKVLITLNTSLIIYTLCVFWHLANCCCTKGPSWSTVGGRRRLRLPFLWDAKHTTAMKPQLFCAKWSLNYCLEKN